MLISKTYSRIAAISLLSLVPATHVWAQENGGEIDSFNRSLGLDGMGTELASVEHEIEHGTTADSAPESPTTPAAKKAPTQKKAPVQRSESFRDLAFSPNPGVTNTMRAYYVSHMNAATLMKAPPYDSLISRFDNRFEKYGFSRHNVADNFAGYLIVTWEILHNADASTNPAGIRRVRAAISQIIEKRGKVAQLSNEAKQKVSEVMKFWVEYSSQAFREARETNNQGAIRKIQTGVNQPLRQYGIDMWQYQLTDKGFVKG
jgi:hypothetical protein